MGTLEGGGFPPSPSHRNCVWVSTDTPLTALCRPPTAPGQDFELAWLCVCVCVFKY